MDKFEKIKSKLQKLSALEAQGEEYEAAAARVKLEKLCRKYGVSLSSILEADSDEVSMYEFQIGRSVLLWDLFLRCYYQVVEDVTDRKYIRSRGSAKAEVECTSLEYVDLRCMWDFYSSLYKKELALTEKAFALAFVRKHCLYFPSEGVEGGGQSELTEEDWELLRRSGSLLRDLTDVSYRKALTEGSYE